MAAVRRSSDSGIVVALVIFIILTVVGLGGAIWSYQQLRVAQETIIATQNGFHDVIHTAFEQNGWELQTQTPAQLGVRYTRQSYEDVAAKLSAAAEYEKVVKPMLGWESLESAETARKGFTVQQEAAQRGDAMYATLRLLLERYDDSYRDLTRRVADLTASRQATAEQLSKTQAELTDSQKRLREENSRNLQDFQTKLGELRAANDDLEARVSKHRQEAVAWQQKHQEEVNAHRTDAARLQAEADRWHKQYEDLVAPPGEREKLVADGEVIEMRSEFDFVVIQGGADQGYKEDDVFIVYTVTPAGVNKRKGTIVVGQVKEHTSIATVLDEEGGYVLAGDPFVSALRWNQFYRHTVAAQQ